VPFIESMSNVKAVFEQKFISTVEIGTQNGVFRGKGCTPHLLTYFAPIYVVASWLYRCHVKRKSQSPKIAEQTIRCVHEVARIRAEMQRFFSVQFYTKVQF